MALNNWELTQPFEKLLNEINSINIRVERLETEIKYANDYLDRIGAPNNLWPGTIGARLIALSESSPIFKSIENESKENIILDK
jgi:hypothetical protein